MAISLSVVPYIRAPVCAVGNITSADSLGRLINGCGVLAIWRTAFMLAREAALMLATISLAESCKKALRSILGLVMMPTAPAATAGLSEFDLENLIEDLDDVQAVYTSAAMDEE